MRTRPFRFVFALFLLLLGAGHLWGQERVRRALIPRVEPWPGFTPAVATAAGPLPSMMELPMARRPLPFDALVIPVAGVTPDELQDNFGTPRSGGRRHQAIDIMAPRGTPVLSATAGHVAKIHLSRTGGKTVYIKDPQQRHIYYYAHLDSYAAGLTEGRAVSRGEVIGFVGATGNASPSAPHLHFAIETLPIGGEWWKGKAMNPFPVLRERGVEREAL